MTVFNLGKVNFGNVDPNLRPDYVNLVQKTLDTLQDYSEETPKVFKGIETITVNITDNLPTKNADGKIVQATATVNQYTNTININVSDPTDPAGEILHESWHIGLPGKTKENNMLHDIVDSNENYNINLIVNEFSYNVIKEQLNWQKGLLDLADATGVQANPKVPQIVETLTTAAAISPKPNSHVSPKIIEPGELYDLPYAPIIGITAFEVPPAEFTPPPAVENSAPQPVQPVAPAPVPPPEAYDYTSPTPPPPPSLENIVPVPAEPAPLAGLDVPASQPDVTGYQAGQPTAGYTNYYGGSYATQAAADHAQDNTQDSNDSSGDGGGENPVILDLSGKGIKIRQLTSSDMFFDMTGAGYKNRTAWAGAGSGVLFVDMTGAGRSSQASQIEFTKWDPAATGDLQALAGVFDTNHDGKLDAGDAAFAKFYVQRVNADGTQTVLSLAQLGIASIDLTGNAVAQAFADGSSIDSETTFTYAGGGTGTVASVTLATSAANRIVDTAKTNAVQSPDGGAEPIILDLSGKGVKIRQLTSSDVFFDMTGAGLTGLQFGGRLGRRVCTRLDRLIGRTFGRRLGRTRGRGRRGHRWSNRGRKSHRYLFRPRRNGAAITTILWQPIRKSECRRQGGTDWQKQFWRAGCRAGLAGGRRPRCGDGGREGK